MDNGSASLTQFENWFAQRNWTPFSFQAEVWQAMLEGESGLLHAPTGMGKTLAVWFGALSRVDSVSPSPGMQVIWITPLRALAGDTCVALREPLAEFAPEWTVEVRTGDTTSHVKKKQEKKPPHALITTPESLTLLLTRPTVEKHMAGLKVVIVDEWHELLGSKRGVQTELALARLRSRVPGLMVWGLSATLGNLDEALKDLLGIGGDGTARQGRLISGRVAKELQIDSLLPESTERFPWAGHLGLKMLPKVVDELEPVSSALVFTNTRSQCELWHQALSEVRSDWRIGLHHGSLANKERRVVEQGLKSGAYKVVVCTSSLDLGVDFSPVERVLQIGSPKGVARLLQRAGRSGHGPGRVSRVTCVPAHVFELVEAAAARDATQMGAIESRPPYNCPLDVLAQHAVSMGLGKGFRKDEMLREVRTTASYKDLTDGEWDWLLEFLSTGGSTLSAYPEYHKLQVTNEIYKVKDKTLAQRHRMAIGTIVSDAAIQVRYLKGGRLGSVEESFISRLYPGDTFLFAGKALQLVKVNNMTAYVRKAKAAGAVPAWQGGRMPLSSELADAVCTKLDAAARRIFGDEEMRLVRPVLALQEAWSAVPKNKELLIERIDSREGAHLYIYPFAGRLVHEGLAALLAYRLAALEPLTFTWAVNDYGFELLSREAPPFEEALGNDLFGIDHLGDDIMASLNSAELAKNRFREIARIAGLVFQGYPGKGKTARQIQATSSLIFDVFQRYDPENPLFKQAHAEVLDRQLERTRLHSTLKKMQAATLRITRPERVTPLAFPLMVDRLREKMSSEKLQDRLHRMLVSLEKHAEQTVVS
ncbi:MAG: ligase-associated DNA damage response DEXH box helicase [Desulfofustis sp.]|nr:ligase-associated DNA damage response DEXH box helicase [Desulfofustis sp.]